MVSTWSLPTLGRIDNQQHKTKLRGKTAQVSLYLKVYIRQKATSVSSTCAATAYPLCMMDMDLTNTAPSKVAEQRLTIIRLNVLPSSSSSFLS